MKYDVFLVSAKDDRDMAELVVRRLRQLKFKVRYDRKRSHTTPAPRDTRDINDSQSVVVLWSKAACDTDNAESDWVHAMAHTARARKDVLLQVGLDDTVPDDPFHLDDRFMIKGMTSRTTPEDFYLFIEELGRRDGRVHLREWLLIPSKDRGAQDVWRERHPNDPLAIKGDPVGVKKMPDPVQSPAASLQPSFTGPSVKPAITSGAAALAAASTAQTTGVRVPATPPSPPPAPTPQPAPPPPLPPVITAPPTAVSTTFGDGAPGAIGTGDAVSRPTREPEPATSVVPAAAPAAPISYAYEEPEESPTRNPIWWILGLIALFFLAAFLWRAQQSQVSAPGALPAIANSVRYAVCPAGFAHRSLFTDDYLATLEAGPIVNDSETGPTGDD
ncbi:MAG: TIR domain-containing protein [Pseudomonadota bacterium]